jgi:hypothetical protein
MPTITPKEFIETVLINEIEDIHLNHPYISFATMAIGIEFLGKCLNDQEDWNAQGRSKADFELAINSLSSLASYRPYLASHNLWDSLRNGFLHSFVPKNTVTLSSRDEADHFQQISSTTVNLKCENFFQDFKNACLEVIVMASFPTRKMDQPLLVVPSKPSTETSNAPASGTTNTQILVPPASNINVSGSTH